MAMNDGARKVALDWLLKRAAKTPYTYPGAEEGNVPSGVLDAIEEFRSLPVEERKERPLLFWLLGEKGTPPYKFTKLEAAYTDESPYDVKCANCLSTYLHVTSGTLICDQMRGVIVEEGWCRLYRSAIEAEEYKAYQEEGNVEAVND